MSLCKILRLDAATCVATGLLLSVLALSPTALGYAFVIAQAAAVAVLAELEYIGLRREVA